VTPSTEARKSKAFFEWRLCSERRQKYIYYY